MLDISTILNNETFTPEEQLEIIKYIDAQLEQMELLLYRLDQLARRASRDDIMEEERLFKRNQNKFRKKSTGSPSAFQILTS